MNIAMLLLSIFALVYTLPFAFVCWIMPKKYVDYVTKRRDHLRASFLYRIMQPWIYLLHRYPSFDISMARIITLLMLIVCILLIFISINGPFSNESVHWLR